jgi:hypothetical protein
MPIGCVTKEICDEVVYQDKCWWAIHNNRIGNCEKKLYYQNREPIQIVCLHQMCFPHYQDVYPQGFPKQVFI